SFSARRGLVSRRQSPIERRRIRRMRASGARLRKKSLVFNLGFADQHDRDVVAYRVDTVASSALQALPVIHDLQRRFAKRNRTYEDLKKFRIHRHKGEMVARGSRIRAGEWPRLARRGGSSDSKKSSNFLSVARRG